MARFICSRGLGEDHMEATTSSLCDLSKRDSSLRIQRLTHKDLYNAAQDAAGRCDCQTPAMTDRHETYSPCQCVYSHIYIYKIRISQLAVNEVFGDYK